MDPDLNGPELAQIRIWFVFCEFSNSTSFHKYHLESTTAKETEHVHAEVNHVLPKDTFGSQKVQRPLTGPMSTEKNIACKT